MFKYWDCFHFSRRKSESDRLLLLILPLLPLAPSHLFCYFSPPSWAQVDYAVIPQCCSHSKYFYRTPSSQLSHSSHWVTSLMCQEALSTLLCLNCNSPETDSFHGCTRSCSWAPLVKFQHCSRRAEFVEGITSIIVSCSDRLCWGRPGWLVWWLDEWQHRPPSWLHSNRSWGLGVAETGDEGALDLLLTV